MQDWMQQAADAAAAASPVVQATPDIVPGRVLHFDGDMLCYWAGGKEDTDVATSRAIAIRKLQSCQEMSGAESVVMHLTAASSTKGDRRIIAQRKPYQGNRGGSAKPKNWAYLRDFWEGYQGSLCRVKLWSSREADDGLALCARDAAIRDQPPIVICTADKDMRMIDETIQLNWNTYELTHVPKYTYAVTDSQGKVFGRKWFWLQMLHGDTADHIPGLPKFDGKACGPATAEKLLAPSHFTATMAADRVAECYSMHYGYGWQAELLEQALLLWLRNDYEASIDNIKVPLAAIWTTAFDKALAVIHQRIKDTYAEAQGFGSGPVPQDITG